MNVISNVCFFEIFVIFEVNVIIKFFGLGDGENGIFRSIWFNKVFFINGSFFIFLFGLFNFESLDGNEYSFDKCDDIIVFNFFRGIESSFDFVFYVGSSVEEVDFGFWVGSRYFFIG